MQSVLQKAIESCKYSEVSFCKFIAANDAGATGGHQTGFYIPHNSYSLLFDEPGKKGSNKDRFIKIKWQDDFETDSRFIYYGNGTRNEYRITRFGRGYPFLTDDNVGNLVIISKISNDYYEAFVLDSDEEIDDFLSAFGMTPVETNHLINTSNVPIDIAYELDRLFNEYIQTLTVDFPSTTHISDAARKIYYSSKGNIDADLIIRKHPDKELLKWLNTEFNLFKMLENNRYHPIVAQPLGSVNRLIEVSNTVLNRRKSRAGKSLEHHLREIFSVNDIPFSSQPITEGKKRPDFIFPNEKYYYDDEFKNQLIFLGAKTTCKDRWRQILNEANRIPHKHLFTLQQGISQNQLKEMHEHDVTLVVPHDHLASFPKPCRGQIMTLKDFIIFVREKCN